MPITDQTARDDFTISGHTFKVFQPFAEGHVLTANEASSLNQTFAENVRNNFSKRITEAKAAAGDSFDHTVHQPALDEYMRSYQFGVRTGGGGGRTSDPVEAEALLTARGMVKAALVKAKKSGTAAEITVLAKQVLQNPKYAHIREDAKATVAKRQGNGGLELDSLLSTEPVAAAPKGKRPA